MFSMITLVNFEVGRSYKFGEDTQPTLTEDNLQQRTPSQLQAGRSWREASEEMPAMTGKRLHAPTF